MTKRDYCRYYGYFTDNKGDKVKKNHKILKEIGVYLLFLFSIIPAFLLMFF